jgi:hypothetical protein
MDFALSTPMRLVLAELEEALTEERLVLEAFRFAATRMETLFNCFNVAVILALFFAFAEDALFTLFFSIVPS